MELKHAEIAHRIVEAVEDEVEEPEVVVDDEADDEVEVVVDDEVVEVEEIRYQVEYLHEAERLDPYESRDEGV